MTIVNIVIGLVVGVAVMWFLIMPAVNSSTAERTNRQVKEFSDQIAEQDAQISALQTELEQYRASRKANIACAAAIDAAISEHYRDNCLGREAVSQVVEQFGYDRTLYVLANTVRHKEHDGRISRDNENVGQDHPHL